MPHLLVTNDFPPRTGGIQSYLWELWRRLPLDGSEVLTTPYPGSAAFDEEQRYTVTRSRERVLLPRPSLTRRVRARAGAIGAGLVVLDPALPAGWIGPRLGLPYGVVVHGAELTVPARLPGARSLLRPVLAGAELLVAAGEYPAAEARRLLGSAGPDEGPTMVVVPPGVDTRRFRPLTKAERDGERARLGVGATDRLVVSMSRLVPRKGMDVLIAASSLLVGDYPDLMVLIAGTGRDRGRLERLVRHLRAPVRLLDRVHDDHLPGLLGAADIFAMLCRSRWGGLEQEGFGIVFLEAAACGVPQVAGESGGSADAVVHGETGLVVGRPADPVAAVAALRHLLDDADLRRRMGEAARRRAVDVFDYDLLASQLTAALTAAEAAGSAPRPGPG